MAHAAETFDFIVTGAGSAGCAVAARLSESGRYTVLLLEAGPPDTNRWIHIPLGAAKVFVDASVNWRFETEPVESLNGRTLYQPRGKVLGGTSSINGTVYMRGTPGDYNQWRQMGCTGWDWDSVLPFFKKAEDQERGPSELHGTGGPLRVSNIPTEYELPAAMIAAAEQAGIPRNPDFNGPTQEGTGYYQFTASKTKRWSSARAYLEPAKARENLKIETNAHATRIVLTDGRASGVVFRQDSIERTAHARREVIISGGAFGSPHLLQLSGIGPAAVLQSHGIAVQHDLAGVGENLQDHFNTYIPYRCAKPVTANDLAISLRRRLMAGAQYLLFGKGMMANTGAHFASARYTCGQRAVGRYASNRPIHWRHRLSITSFSRRNTIAARSCTEFALRAKLRGRPPWPATRSGKSRQAQTSPMTKACWRMCAIEPWPTIIPLGPAEWALAMTRW